MAFVYSLLLKDFEGSADEVVAGILKVYREMFVRDRSGGVHVAGDVVKQLATNANDGANRDVGMLFMREIKD